MNNEQLGLKEVIMKNWILFLLSAPISMLSHSDDVHSDTWLCISEDSTGFYFEDGKWGQAKFDVSDDKFIVRPLKESDGRYFKDKEHTYGVFDLGRDHPSKRCKSNISIVCKVGLGELFFSPKSGRFIKTYPVGYWDGQNNNNNTPHITRGRCSKI